MVALAPILSARQLVLFDTKDEVNASRGHALAEEFELDMVMLGSGNEFRRLDDIVAMGREFVLPVDFPDAPVVRNAEEADSVSLRDLMTWDEAPSNPARLRDAGVVFFDRPRPFEAHRYPRSHPPSHSPWSQPNRRHGRVDHHPRATAWY